MRLVERRIFVSCRHPSASCAAQGQLSQPPSRPAGGAPVEILDAIVGFDDTVNQSGRHERSVYVSARATAGGTELENGDVPAIRLSSEKARAAAAMVQSIALSRAGQLPQARTLLDGAERQARAAAKQFEDAELEAAANEMVELRRALPAVQRQPVVATPGGLTPGAGGGIDTSAAPEPFPESAPATVRRSHDRAMRKLQGR